MAENPQSKAASLVKTAVKNIRTRGKAPKGRAPRPKLLISIVNRGEGRRVRDILSEYSAGLNFSFRGTGTARSHLLDYLGIGETEKTVMFTLIPETDEEAIMREIRAQMTLYLAGRGISFTVPLAGVSQKIANGLMDAAKNKTIVEEKIMKHSERQYNLVIAAVDAAHIDEAMDAARSAGASGGTVVRARATDNEKAEQFIGISLMREQELLLILAKKESTGPIMEAISEKVGVQTSAGGVIFALPVDKTAGISAIETYAESEKKEPKEEHKAEKKDEHAE